MEAAIRQHAADLDRQLGTAPPPPPPSTEGYADAYARKMTQFEVPTSHDSRTHTVATLLGALADPYVLILVAYVAAVALQLVWLTRSALQGRLANALHKPTRVRVLLAAAVLSLLATWYNMFAYLVWSYNAFLERTALTGQELTSMPLCSIHAHRQGVRCALAKSTAHTMRVSAWLRQTVLFQEAWLSVVRGRHNWWWSVEVCLFTVGVWALFVRTHGKRFGVRHAWAYMVLGQTCAISVAQNLFAVALAVRALQPKKASRRSSSSVRSDAELMPPPSARVSKRSLAAAAVASEVDGVSGLLLNAALAAAGLAFVYMIPDTMLKLASMHLAPMLIVLPLVDMSARQLNAYIRPSLLYGLIAWLSFTIRMRTHSAVLASSDRLLPTMFSQPAQTSISADAVCITLSVMLQLYLFLADGVLSFAEGWALLVLTPLVGPSTTFASALALVESRREEAIDGVTDGDGVTDNDAATAKQQANTSSTSAKSTPRKSQGASDTPSGKATSSPRKSGSTSKKASRTSSSHSAAASSADESSSGSKVRRSSSGSRSTRAKATTEEATSSSTRSKPRKSKAAATSAASETDGEASSASTRGPPPLADTPAGRAKRTRARPRKMDAVDGEQLVASEAEIGSAPSRRRRGSSSARRSVRS